jgi:serine/threonine-protein kinase
MIGKTIGKYRFVEELGRGGMGTVYKAIDETLDREVAVKVLNPELSDSELMKHFQAEATILARLHHPDIAGIHEIHRTDTDLLMVMELVQGETLEQLAERCGPLPPERAAYLVAQVLGALEHAHSAGVIHRDLRPSKVTVTEAGGVKVMDFGMTRVAGAEQLTSDGFALGTPAYMAPERLAGKEIDGRADVYSAGVMFYRLLTGHVPFEAATPLEMVQKQLSGTPTPIHTYRPDLPGWCQAILDRALARSPADRFPTAEAFRTTLLAAISEATESTGVFSVVQGSGVANPEAVTTLLPIPAQASSSPAPKAEPPTVSTWIADHPERPALRPPAPAAGATTLVLKKNQFALVGGLLLVLVIGVVALAVVALRRPATMIVSPTEGIAQAPPSTPASASAPVAAPPPPSAPAPDAAPSSAVPPAASPVTAPPLEVVAPPLVLPAPATAPAPVPAPRPGLVVTPLRFDARAVVADGDKRRERDASILVADGTLTVTEKDKNTRALYVVPLDSVVGLTYSSSRQPLWDSPEGPAEAMRVEGGAFGFLKGGRNNWFGLRTKDSLLVLRVDDDAVARVMTGLQERTGLTLQRLVEPKD